MLIGQDFFEDGGKVVHKRTFDFTDTVDSVQRLRHANEGAKSENWHIGRIPPALIGIWLKEAGVEWSDSAAVKETIEKNLLSGEYSNLRPHEGKFK